MVDNPPTMAAEMIGSVGVCRGSRSVNASLVLYAGCTLYQAGRYDQTGDVVQRRKYDEHERLTEQSVRHEYHIGRHMGHTCTDDPPKCHRRYNDNKEALGLLVDISRRELYTDREQPNSQHYPHNFERDCVGIAGP